MMLINFDDWIVLNGKKHHFHHQVVGIDPDGDVYNGFGDQIGGIDLTAEERMDLGRIMLIRWSEYLGKAEADLKETADKEAR
jgi:hypothetical protein